MTLEEYLKKISKFTDNDYGQMVRNQFKDLVGSSELGLLACPSKNELAQLKKAVAIMTEAEKANPCDLTDEQIQTISSDAGIDTAVFAIFINGHALEIKKNANN